MQSAEHSAWPGAEAAQTLGLHGGPTPQWQLPPSLPRCLRDLPQSPQPRSRTKPGAAPRGPLLKVNPFVLGTLPAPTRGRLRASSNHRTTYSQRPARAAPSAVIRQQRGVESPSATVWRVLNGTISRTRQGARGLGKMGSLEEAAIETATPPPPAAAE